MPKLKVLDLFSGIGGFSLGLERAGMRTVAFCEIDPYCRAVLRKHWPGVPIFENIKLLTADDVPNVGLICGGFPCQPVSHAGKQLGKEDDRWLWPEYRRLIGEYRDKGTAPIVVGENVIGLVGMELDGVLADLEALGYAWRAFDIPACAVGAPHQRRRIWIVAYPQSKSGNGCESEHPKPTSRASQPELGNRIGATSPNFVGERIQRGFQEALSRFCGLSWGEDGGRGEISGDRPYLPEPTIRRTDDGIRARLHAIGNAVVPQIPEIIGRAILAAQHQQ